MGDNLVWGSVLSRNDQICTGGCGLNEDKDHLFVTCDFYGKILMVVSCWLGFSMAAQGNLSDHLIQFAG